MRQGDPLRIQATWVVLWMAVLLKLCLAILVAPLLYYVPLIAGAIARTTEPLPSAGRVAFGIAALLSIFTIFGGVFGLLVSVIQRFIVRRPPRGWVTDSTWVAGRAALFGWSVIMAIGYLVPTSAGSNWFMAIFAAIVLAEGLEMFRAQRRLLRQVTATAP